MMLFIYESTLKSILSQIMLSVPYSQFADKAGRTPSDGDTSATNELQALSVSNDTIYLSSGGFVKLPSGAVNWTYYSKLNWANDSND